MLGRLIHRWEDSVKMDRTALRKGGREVDSSGLGHGQVMKKQIL